MQEEQPVTAFGEAVAGFDMVWQNLMSFPVEGASMQLLTQLESQLLAVRWCDGTWHHFQLMMLGAFHVRYVKENCSSSRSNPSGYVCLHYLYIIFSQNWNSLFGSVLHSWNLSISSSLIWLNTELQCFKNNFSSIYVTADPAVWFIFWDLYYIILILLCD